MGIEYVECAVCGSLIEYTLQRKSVQNESDLFLRAEPCAICLANAAIKAAINADAMADDQADDPTVYVYDTYYDHMIEIALSPELMEISMYPVDEDHAERRGDPEIMVKVSDLLEALDYLGQKVGL